MEHDIRDIIEKIKNGEVPEGYIKTLYGLYPNDWKKESFDDLFEFWGGMSIPRDKLGDEGIAYLHYGDIHKSNKSLVKIFQDYENLPKLKIDINNVKDGCLLMDGDIVFADASEDYEGIGKSVVISNTSNIHFISGLHTIIAKSKNKSLNNEYKRYLVRDWSIRKQIMRLATGISVLGISKSNISLINIVYPPLPEQQKIATILSTWDKVIELKEKLIEEKKKQKRGLMQQLLTGEVRLPGFDGEWKEVKLGDISKFQQGLQVPVEEQYDEGKNNRVRFIRIIDYTQTNQDVRYIDYSRNVVNKMVNKDDIVMIRYGVPGVIGRGIEGVIANNMFKISFNKQIIEIDFIYYSLNQERVQQYLLNNSTSTTMPAISFDIVKSILLNIPNLKEQEEITKRLSTADNEIDLLTQELQALKLQKKGLMQLLVTGIVRVNTES